MFYPKDDGSLVSLILKPQDFEEGLVFKPVLANQWTQLSKLGFDLVLESKLNFIFLKLDFSKAYDKVDWNFLFDCIDKLEIPLNLSR